MTALIRGARWVAAGIRWRAAAGRAARRAYYEGRDLLAALAAPVQTAPPLPPWRAAPPASTLDQPTPQTQPVCPGCDSRRCRHHREGEDCRTAGLDKRPAYAAGMPLPRPGRHTVDVRVAHWARIVHLHELRDRIGMRPRVVILP